MCAGRQQNTLWMQPARDEPTHGRKDAKWNAEPTSLRGNTNRICHPVLCFVDHTERRVLEFLFHDPGLAKVTAHHRGMAMLAPSRCCVIWNGSASRSPDSSWILKRRKTFTKKGLQLLLRRSQLRWQARGTHCHRDSCIILRYALDKSCEISFSGTRSASFWNIQLSSHLNVPMGN